MRERDVREALGMFSRMLSSGHFNADRVIKIGVGGKADIKHDMLIKILTRLSSLGVAQEDVAAVLNHIRRDITGRVYDLYQRGQKKRDALNLWGKYLTSTLKARGAGS